DLLLTPPVAEQARWVAHVRVELHVSAAVGEPDHRVRAPEDLRDGLGVHVDLAQGEYGVQVLLDGQIEEGVSRMLAFRLRDLCVVRAGETAGPRERGCVGD